MASKVACNPEGCIKLNQSTFWSKRTRSLRTFIFFLASFFVSSPLATLGQTVVCWGDASPAGWTASTLNDARSDYFQGEVIPFVYKFSSTGLVNGQSYTFNIKYDYYKETGNAGGYAYITTYNEDRDPDESIIGANPAIDNTATAANTGFFYTVNADITSAVFLADDVSGTTTSKVVAVTFTFTGTPGDDIIVYWGMFLSKKGSVPDQGFGVTEGASHWPGGSLAVIVSGVGGGGNVGNNPGAGGVVEGVISGKKYNDANQNGTMDNGEAGLAGWTIYLDLDNNNEFGGSDVSVTTASDGTYSFGDLLPGTYYVREVNQNGWTQYEPAGPGFEHTIVLDAVNFNHPNKNFGNYECPASGGGSAAAGTSPICSGGSTTITLTGQTGSIVKWQYSTDGSTWNDIASTANPLNTGALTTTTQFRAVVQSGACAAQNSSAATVTVDPTTVGGSTAAGTSPICSGSSTNITLSGNTGAIVKWQYSTDGSTWNDIASTANPLNTGALTTTTQFRAVVQSGACLEQNSAATTVVVDP
ncbi:MAG TPA: SdrD B-like domain-containing protein, partial [Chitinophagaceae bacterium]